VKRLPFVEKKRGHAEEIGHDDDGHVDEEAPGLNFTDPFLAVIY
jgi:hypothetical protein